MGENSSNTVLLVFLFIVLFFICLDLLSPKKTYSEKITKSNKELDEELRKQEEFNRLQKRLRSIYWDSLGNIYDSLSTDVLLKARKKLENMVEYHTHEGINERNVHYIDLWYCELAELRILLDNPTWTDSSNSQDYNMPLFEDLDVKYIDELIQLRNNRPKRNYREQNQHHY